MYQLSILRQCLSTRSSPFLKASCCDLSFCSICHLGHSSTSDRKNIWSFSSLSESLARCNFLEARQNLLNIHEHPQERKEPHWLFEWFIKLSCMFHKGSHSDNHTSSAFYLIRSQLRGVSETPRYTSLGWQHGLSHTFGAGFGWQWLHLQKNLDFGLWNLQLTPRNSRDIRDSWGLEISRMIPWPWLCGNMSQCCILAKYTYYRCMFKQNKPPQLSLSTHQV